MNITGNKGEWSEIYIFLKLMYDRKVHAADGNMNRLDDAFLNIVKIIREEIRNHIYEYYTGDIVKIIYNKNDMRQAVPVLGFKKNAEKVLDLMLSSTGTFGCVDVEEFLASIYITKLKAPAVNNSGFFGGTQDITMSVMDYRSGLTSTIGFSCKSDFASRATLFNASAENTNFVYEITGPICDDLMKEVNSMYNARKKTIIGGRAKRLKEAGCDLTFVEPCKQNAKRNLVLSGGRELPQIVGEILKYYFWHGEATVAHAPIDKAVEHLSMCNPADYDFEDIASLYKRKVSGLLYDMFTGMRLGSLWDGASSVNGGYVVMKSDGDVLAYHTCIADEFKDFLIKRLALESPSASRHKYMQVYKENGRYYIKFNLQIRFR